MNQHTKMKQLIALDGVNDQLALSYVQEINDGNFVLFILVFWCYVVIPSYIEKYHVDDVMRSIVFTLRWYSVFCNIFI